MTCVSSSLALTFPTEIMCRHICHHWKLWLKRSPFSPVPPPSFTWHPIHRPQVLNSAVIYDSPLLVSFQMPTSTSFRTAWLWIQFSHLSFLPLHVILQAQVLSSMSASLHHLPSLPLCLPTSPLLCPPSIIPDLHRTLKNTQQCPII